jgi:hypothetical protein
MEAQQIEGKEHCLKRRLRREKILHPKAVRVLFRSDLLDALFNRGPFVVIPPKGVTALGVEWTGFDPKTGRDLDCIVLCRRLFGSVCCNSLSNRIFRTGRCFLTPGFGLSFYRRLHAKERAIGFRSSWCESSSHFPFEERGMSLRL